MEFEPGFSPEVHDKKKETDSVLEEPVIASEYDAVEMEVDHGTSVLQGLVFAVNDDQGDDDDNA